MSGRMARSDKQRKRQSIIKYALFILITAMLLGLIYKVGQNMISLYNKNQRETAVLSYGCLEDRLKGEGLVLRNEAVWQAPANGRLENLVAEREKVRRHDLLGYYINSGNKIAIKASGAGIFSARLDGLEAVLQEISLQTTGLEVFKYKTQTAVPGAEIIKGQGVCKIVNNLIPSQLLLHFSPASRNMQLSKGQKVQLYVDSRQLGNFTIRDYKWDSRDLFILVEGNEFREDLLNKRLVEAEIILDSRSGYLVPEKSVVNRGKEKGIYCTKSEEIVFKPVKVLKQKDDKALIEGLNPTDIIIVNPGIIKEKM